MAAAGSAQPDESGPRLNRRNRVLKAAGPWPEGSGRGPVQQVEEVPRGPSVRVIRTPGHQVRFREWFGKELLGNHGCGSVAEESTPPHITQAAPGRGRLSFRTAYLVNSTVAAFGPAAGFG